MKLLPPVFSSLYRRIKTFVFAVNSKRHYFCMIYLRITRKEQKIRGNLCRLLSAVNVMLNFPIVKIAVDPRGDSCVDPQTTLIML